MKKIVGLVPTSNIGDTDKSCMQEYYGVYNNYSKRLTEAGCIPIGLAPCDNFLSQDVLDLCDAFLVQGGPEFYPYHFQVIDYAIKSGKKYLGICLGQQLIYAYFELKRRIEEEGDTGDTVKGICDYLSRQSPDFSVQKKIPDHRYDLPKKGDEDSAKHEINILPDTLLHKVLKKDKIRICSFHSLCTPPEQTLVTINAFSALNDGVVEGTEYGENILGIQGHPEADGLLPEFFAFLAE